MKILALSGSNSSNSINQQLIDHVTQILHVPSDTLNLRDYQLPIFSIDDERDKGLSAELQTLAAAFRDYDGYVISIPEHNGNYPAFFKNIIDWLTRIERRFLKGKPVLLMNACPGLHGGESVMRIAADSFPHLGGNVVGTFRLPEFSSFVKQDPAIMENSAMMSDLKEVVAKFESFVEDECMSKELV